MATARRPTPRLGYSSSSLPTGRVPDLAKGRRIRPPSSPDRGPPPPRVSRPLQDRHRRVSELGSTGTRHRRRHRLRSLGLDSAVPSANPGASFLLPCLHFFPCARLDAGVASSGSTFWSAASDLGVTATVSPAFVLASHRLCQPLAQAAARQRVYVERGGGDG